MHNYYNYYSVRQEKRRMNSTRDVCSSEMKETNQVHSGHQTPADDSISDDNGYQSDERV